MRLHRLSVNAFGPFSHTVDIEFDPLAEQGLFLLHGATGAGKTSILDAICFALYGDLPGRRSGSGRQGSVRSHLAPPDAQPQVVCEFSVADRRLEVTRCPAWDRPKKRGHGTTAQQASVVVREYVDGQWMARATRLDEAGLLLGEVLGMTKDQFTTVVLLPQGEFAQFLLAQADERKELLQRLFGTDRFAQVEAWLAQRRRETARACEVADQHAQLLSARVADRFGDVADLVSGSDDFVFDNDTATLDPAVLLGAVRDVQEPSEATLRGAEQALTQSEQAADVARQAHQLLRDGHTVRAELDTVVAQAGAICVLREQVAAAGRTDKVAGHLETLDRAQSEYEDATRDQRESMRAVAALLPEPMLPVFAGDSLPPAQELAQAVADRRREIAAVENLLNLEDEVAAWVAEQHKLVTQDVTLQERVAACQHELDALGAQRHELVTRKARDAALAAELPLRRVEVSRARTQADAAGRLVDATDRLAAARDLAQRLIDAAQDARGAYLDLAQRRLDGIAAELATGLRPGQACPVCGADEHPRPASAAAGTSLVTAHEVQTAGTAAHEAQAVAEQAKTALADARAEHATWLHASEGRTVAQAQEALTAAKSHLLGAETAAATEQELARRLDTVAEQLSTVTADRATAQDRRDALNPDLVALSTRIHDAQSKLSHAAGTDGSVWERHSRLTSEVKLLDSARDALTRCAAADTALNRARRAAIKASRAAGFGTVEETRAAQRDAAALADMTARIAAHHDATVRLRARLDETTSRLAGLNGCGSAAKWADALLTISPEELPVVVEQAHEQKVHRDAERGAASTSRERAAEAVRRLTQAVTGIERAAQELTQHLEATASLRTSAQVAGELASCMEGGRGSNTLRMRLSAYVLAARLAEVAAAASQRLEIMSSGRYRLVHTEASAKATGRAGLGIAVSDAWTGQDRDPTTLSGGERFLASLALALGLADVVQAESGGVVLETLFVDEGFGSLDEEALDHVLTVLDGLRTGGRAVGVVSHVAELRQRIPAQIHVVRDQAGSTVDLH